MNCSRRELFWFSAAAALEAEPLFVEPISFQKGQNRAEKPWYLSSLVGMELGPTGANDQDTIYMARATGRDWVESLVRAGAEYGVIFMKDQNFAYYNSQIARRCPNLGQRDLLSECISAASKHGIPIIAYCQIQYDTAAWQAHPEWRMKDSDGNDIHDRLCYNSGYLAYNSQIAVEMLQYQIAGFHFDMLDFGFSPPVGCWCEHCKSLFEQEYGIAMPRGITWDEAWDKMLQFRCDSNTRFCEKLSTLVHQQKPNASVDFNYHGYPPFSWYPGEKPVQHARNGDFVTAEGLPWIFGNYNPSLLALFMAGARPGGPIQGVTSRSVYNYHDFTVRPTADMEWEVFTYLAHGAQCTIVDKANYDGTLDQVVYQRIGKIFRSARAKTEFFGHKPIQDVGLYYSSRSRDWYGRADGEKYMAAFSGAHKALVQAHITLGMIMDENASIERLSEFPVVYVPNAAILTQQEVANFKAYVQQGGNLFLTGMTGVCNHYGNLQDHSSLEELAGVRLLRCQIEFPDNYLRLPSSLQTGKGQFLTPDIPLDWPILMWGSISIYEANGAEGFGELILAVRSKNNSWSKHMSPGAIAGPAVFVNNVGKGKVVLVPCMLDAAYIQRYRVPEQRYLIRNVMRYLHPKPAIQIDAPANVEAVVAHDGARNRTLIHLISFSAPATATSEPLNKGREVLPPVMEEPMSYEARVVFGTHFAGVKSPNVNTRLTVKGRDISVTTRDIHTIIEFQL